MSVLLPGGGACGQQKGDLMTDNPLGDGPYQEYLCAAVSNAPDAVFIHDYQGQIIEVNNRAVTYLGYSRQELLQMTVMDIDANYPELSALQSVWEDLSSGRTETLLGSHKRKDSSTFEAEVHLSAFKSGDQRLVVAFVRDQERRDRLTDASKQEMRNCLKAAMQALNAGPALDFRSAA